MIGPFSGEHGYLSNFWYSPFSFYGVAFKSAEHFYQANKADNERDWLRIISAPSPGGSQAPRPGRPDEQ
jgi:predicted NAD-dependent protein-ADP-ribosyltransferase YbiA (DUF1768 family)